MKYSIALVLISFIAMPSFAGHVDRSDKNNNGIADALERENKEANNFISKFFENWKLKKIKKRDEKRQAYQNKVDGIVESTRPEDPKALKRLNGDEVIGQKGSCYALLAGDLYLLEKEVQTAAETVKYKLIYHNSNYKKTASLSKLLSENAISKLDIVVPVDEAQSTALLKKQYNNFIRNRDIALQILVETERRGLCK